MNSLLYAKLAKTNLSKNRQNILPYLLSCIGTVIMFYIMSTLAVSDGFKKMIGEAAIQEVMQFGVYIIGLFAVIFLIYSNSFLTKRRKKEFGLFQILGMEKKHLAKVLFFESLYLWILSVGAGILLGILCYKLLFLVLLKLTRLQGTIHFAFNWKALGNTVVLFAVIFLINYLKSLQQIHAAQPIELLHGEQEGEREPKTKLLTALIGLICLGLGYYLALTCQNPMEALGKFFGAVLLVMAGTYCLFSAGSIALLKLLKNNKRYYYQTRHFTSISGMLYRMKQNAMGLANICILSTGVLLVISTTSCLWFGMQEIIQTRFPHQIAVEVNDSLVSANGGGISLTKEEIDALREQINGYLENQQAAKRYERDETYWLAMAENKEDRVGLTTEVKGFADGLSLTEFMEASEYERMTGQAANLKPGQVLVLTTKEKPYGYDTIRFGDAVSCEVKHMENAQKDTVESTNVVYDTRIIVFADREEARAAYVAVTGKTPAGYSWNYQIDLIGDAKQQIQIGQGIRDIVDQAHCDGYVEVREDNKDSLYRMYGSIMFLGIFVGTLFLMGAVMIIYYKQISEGFDDRKRFQIMQKVGMSRQEVRQIIRAQVVTVFFLPLAVAILHTAVAFPVTRQLMTMMNFPDSGIFLVATAVTIVAFAMVYLIVYTITARAYYKIVE